MDAVSLADQKEDCAAYIAFFTTYIAHPFFGGRLSIRMLLCRKILKKYL